MLIGCIFLDFSIVIIEMMLSDMPTTNTIAKHTDKARTYLEFKIAKLTRLLSVMLVKFNVSNEEFIFFLKILYSIEIFYFIKHSCVLQNHFKFKMISTMVMNTLKKKTLNKEY